MRFIVAIISGLVIAFGLFLLMHVFISGGPQVNVQQAQNAQMINFVRVKRQENLRHKQYQKPQKPKPQKQPPPEHVSVNKTQHPHVQTPQMNVPHLNTAGFGGNGAGPFLGSGVGGGGQGPGGAGEGDVIPLVEIQPQYPRQAAINGTEGSVTLQFTINPDGTVSNPSVVKSSNRIFNNAAREAIRKWKFKPRVVNGKAVARTATQTIQFSLDQNQ